ncbi:hypothetical protein CAPTEDRAFT_213477 [Capitella teleta]|uniref:WSC domain-containing protein n=1 Tax=Capitella teleta TaxID=283909 RepID=R7TTW8_CAPTE|nr:hypothetical protein CAPTEDRAFT_213477 [Capitella teleta]|eukprot:ELT94460.1 hypothetical protein CAPTEDRAFT_213477 [Capitella teleta]
MTFDRFLLQINHSSRECYCGNRYDYDRHGLKPSGCTSNCRGNTGETCGGQWRIQIYSVCPTGKYKGAGDPVINDEPNCENECHCDGELPCFFTNGTCKDKCATGWRGITCNERDCGGENGGCQYQCTDDKRDEWCSCDEGFDISSNDWRECIDAQFPVCMIGPQPHCVYYSFRCCLLSDINECAGEKGEYYDEDCHTCVNTIGSYTCECDDSYELDSATNQTCVDINECLGESGVNYDKDCHECINTIGSYTCRCDHGYGLLPNGTSCGVKETARSARIAVKPTELIGSLKE